MERVDIDPPIDHPPATPDSARSEQPKRMSEQKPVFIAGAYEHPTREAPNTATEQLHAEVARGALDDAGISKDEVDGYLTAGPSAEVGPMPSVQLTEYLGLDPSFVDSTDHGGSSYVSHVGHAANAIRQGQCEIALISLASRPRSSSPTDSEPWTLQTNFERVYGANTLGQYALAAQRHMHEFGTTSEQLAEIRVAASEHAQYNENAMYREPVTVDDVVSSRQIADPLRLLDCCVVSDGGGALLVVSGAIRDEIDRECVEVLGYGEAIKHNDGGRVDLSYTGGRHSGTRAFADAGLRPADVDYASLYDSFTITVLTALEDLGFCERGRGGQFVEDGALRAPDGELPFNTDGGGLCSNHPDRGGMTKVIEAVRQLRGEANDPVQVTEPEVALAHGVGRYLGSRHAAATLLLGRAGR